MNDNPSNLPKRDQLGLSFFPNRTKPLDATPIRTPGYTTGARLTIPKHVSNLGDRMTSRNYNARLVALLGLVTAAFLLVFGYRIGAVGGTDPLGDVGRAVAVGTLALTFGYNLGLATKQKQVGGAESVFYTWFFGSFAGLTGIASVYTIVFSGFTLTALVNSRAFQDSSELVFGTLIGSLAISSGFVETARIRYLKRGFSVFSEYLSQAFLFGYVTIKTTGDFSIGISLSGAVVVVLVVATKREAIRKWIRGLLNPLGASEA